MQIEFLPLLKHGRAIKIRVTTNAISHPTGIVALAVVTVMVVAGAKVVVGMVLSISVLRMENRTLLRIYHLSNAHVVENRVMMHVTVIRRDHL